MQRLRPSQGNFRRLLPMFPWAARRLAPAPCDLVLTSSSAFAHGLTAPPGAIHVCYCHAPFRYAWYEQSRALAEVPAVLRGALRAQRGQAIFSSPYDVSLGSTTAMAAARLTRPQYLK